jgi:predicted NUDIX family NTP pyrophosphohydrolase
MKQSAGVLLYRMSDGGLEVLLVHPSGNYNRHAPWSIPKGLADVGEQLEQAACRETIEETGVVPEALVPLGSVVLTKSRKQIHCFAGPAPTGAAPHPATWEVDRAEFVALPDARKLLHPEQVPLLDRLAEIVGRRQ